VSDQAVLILGEGAAELAELILNSGAVRAPLTACPDNGEVLEIYADQPVLLGDPMSISQVLKDMPAVKWVQSTWAGVTPLLQAERRDYQLTGIKGVFGPQMSEYVLGHILAHELHLVDRLSAQRQRRWQPTRSGTLPGRKLGVMGTGSIGAAIAGQARNNGMVVTGLSRSGASHSSFDNVYATAEIADFLAPLDYLVSVLPDTATTRGLLNSHTLAMLPAHACFINVGRGNVVDDDALISALRDGRLGGAVLDVFDEEPVPQDSPLWDAPNLIMTPHIAAVSYPELIVPIFLENYRRYVAGQALLNKVSFENGY
jgi:phosphoglycerate dehydrogenase-like enzyme